MRILSALLGLWLLWAAPARAALLEAPARPDPALVELAQIPRVALHVHREYVEPIALIPVLEGAIDGALVELGPRALLTKPEALARLGQALTLPSGEGLTATEAVTRSVDFFRGLWDGSAAGTRPDEGARVAAASLKSMLGALDPYSRYYTPAEYAQTQHLFRGSQGKLGVTFEDKASGPRLVTAVAPGSPAEAAGLRVGDEVIAVDAAPVAGLDLDPFRALLRRPEVSLTVRRGDAPPFEARLRRGDVPAPEVLRSLMLVGGAGYLRIALFKTDAAEEIQQRLLKLLAAGARSVILDLRGNPGGEAQTVLQASSLFLPKGATIARFLHRHGTDAASTSEDGELAATPVKVLVDGDTASASEIMAAAIQENGRGPLIGARTYGKGTAQQFFQLEDGSGFKMTIGRWETPSGRRLDREKDGGGLEPDIPVAPAAAPGTDPVVERALQP